MSTEPKILPVLMAGGSGSRLWPLSRELYPKQFLSLVDERSLLQNTALRAGELPNALPPLVLCGEEHRFIVAEQLRSCGIDQSRIILEPEGRNTAPAAAVAAHFATDTFGSGTLVFLMAADHVIANLEAFKHAVKLAIPVAEQGRIVTFGIQPTQPETGFGYLRAGTELQPNVYEVAQFIEKPSAEVAEEFLKEGGFYWNAGMFLFRADIFLDELQKLEPDIYTRSLEALKKAKQDLDFIRLDSKAFKTCRADSIDYAVMEKTQHIALIPLDAGWDDVGSWTYLSKLKASDEHGNVTHGDVMIEDSANNLVRATSRLVALVGISNHIVVETRDAVLVTRRDSAQNVKKIVQRLKLQKRSEAQIHPRVYRPWGWYETIVMSDLFQVKHILVNSGHKLSLQMHHHRAEHWVVVKGTARVTCEDKVFLLSEDQSTYIPLGHKHRLDNPGKIALEMIEVQSGIYLGEDDIVRFEDVYGR